MDKSYICINLLIARGGVGSERVVDCDDVANAIFILAIAVLPFSMTSQICRSGNHCTEQGLSRGSSFPVKFTDRNWSKPSVRPPHLTFARRAFTLNSQGPPIAGIAVPASTASVTQIFCNE